MFSVVRFPVLLSRINLNSVHCARLNGRTYSSGYELTNVAPSIKSKIFWDASKKFQYYQMPQFGTEYAGNKRRIQRILELECRIYDEEESKQHLERSKDQAKAHQETQKNREPIKSKVLGSLKKSFQEALFGPQMKDSFAKIEASSNELEAPELSIIEHSLPNVVAASSKGRRIDMEDKHIAANFDVQIGQKTEKVTVTGVFDGRCGIECSAYAAANFQSTLKFYLESFNATEWTDKGIINALTLTLVKLSQGYNKENVTKDKESFNEDAGTTANIAMRIGKTLWIANTGDSRAILIDAEGVAHQLSRDVGPHEPRYSTWKIEGTNSLILTSIFSETSGRRAKGGALGQHFANGKISARPDILKITADEFNGFRGTLLIQCCDGITDVAATNEIAQRFKEKQKQGLPTKSIAADMVNAAYTCESKDNLSLLIQPLE